MVIVLQAAEERPGQTAECPVFNPAASGFCGGGRGSCPRRWVTVLQAGWLWWAWPTRSVSFLLSTNVEGTLLFCQRAVPLPSLMSAAAWK